MKRSIFFFTLFFFCFTVNNTLAQHQKEHPRGSYVDSLGRYYLQADQPLRIFVATPSDSVPAQLKEAEMKEYKPIYLDGHGLHNLRHINTEEHRVENFQLYADGIAPVTYITQSRAPRHTSNGRVFYGTNLHLSLRATDEMSGIKETFFSLNGADYIPYRYTLPVTEEGDYVYKYYSVDNVGNVERAKEESFTVDVKPPNTYYKIVGITDDKVVSLTSQISITAEDSLSGVSVTYYSFDDGSYRQGYGLIPISDLDNGEHTLSFYSIDNVGNQELLNSVKFYLDRTAPIMSADILGDKFIVEDQVYFSGRTKVKLTAIDNRAGIDEVRFSINDGAYELYTEPFYLPNKSGRYIITYYATDKVGNNTGENKTTHSNGVVYVDLTGPVITNTFEGQAFRNGDVTYISSKVANRITATDSESDVQKLAYIINDSEEQTYMQPFTMHEPGLHRIIAVAYDNVNNRNEKPFGIFVDNEGPEIGYSFSTKPSSTDDEKIDIYPSYVTLFLSALDQSTTVASIGVSINGGEEIPYTSPIQGFEKSRTYQVKVRSTDVLGNESTKSFTFKTNDL
ncbi:MAG: hypothetical protein LBG19_11030 [Prevotellaceae bacterium]|jgi:hypothetical protein|nr:hypothetical protein [Prevotellaceae bacterium]